MTRMSIKLGLAAALGLAALCLGLPERADAATLSFTAQVYSFRGRQLNVGSYALDGITPGLGFEHEALQVDYNTSGLPYYVSNITYVNTPLTKFVINPGSFPPSVPPFLQPVTIASLRAPGVPLGSSSPGAMANVIGAGFGNRVSQDFALIGGSPEFEQGASNAELTYVEIDNAAGEMKGHGGGFTNDILSFNGSNVIVTFSLLPGAPGGLPATVTLQNAFAIATPANDTDPNFHNYGTTGQSSEDILGVTPEPGPLLTLMGLGVSASLFYWRRRRA